MSSKQLEFFILYWIEINLIISTGCDHATFNKSLQRLNPYYDLYTCDNEFGYICKKMLGSKGKPKGMKRNITACGCLGIILVCYHMRGSYSKPQAMIFNQTSTLMYK